jgi:hypothetical protein
MSLNHIVVMIQIDIGNVRKYHNSLIVSCVQLPLCILVTVRPMVCVWSSRTKRQVV